MKNSEAALGSFREGGLRGWVSSIERLFLLLKLIIPLSMENYTQGIAHKYKQNRNRNRIKDQQGKITRNKNSIQKELQQPIVRDARNPLAPRDGRQCKQSLLPDDPGQLHNTKEGPCSITPWRHFCSFYLRMGLAQIPSDTLLPLSGSLSLPCPADHKTSSVPPAQSFSVALFMEVGEKVLSSPFPFTS